MGEHTIKCVISEQEVLEMGFSVEEIITNGARTQEFMNHIFDMAEEEFQMKFEMGVKTVQVEYRSDRTLSLTFSNYPADEVLGRLKDLIGGLLGSMTPEKFQELQEAAASADDGDIVAEVVDYVLILEFPDFDHVVHFAKQLNLPEEPSSMLLKYKGRYYLTLDFEEEDDEGIRAVTLMTDEYGIDMQVGRERLAFLEEHGRRLLSCYAVEHLRTF